jgi:hypothetical protein
MLNTKYTLALSPDEWLLKGAGNQKYCIYLNKQQRHCTLWKYNTMVVVVVVKHS